MYNFKLLCLLLSLFLATPSFGAWQGNGSSQYAIITDSTTLDLPDSAWTFAYWFYIDSNAGTSYNVVYTSDNTALSSNPSHLMYCNETSASSDAGKLSSRQNDDDTTDKLVHSTNTVCDTTGSWRSVILQRDTSGATIKTYINNSEETSTADTSFNAMASPTNWKLFADSAPSHYFPGRLAEMGQWNRLLSAAERTTLQKFGPECINGLVWHIPMVRVFQEVRKNLTVTNTGSLTVATHPPLIRCQ